jgi:hypothetical protein
MTSGRGRAHEHVTDCRVRWFHAVKFFRTWGNQVAVGFLLGQIVLNVEELLPFLLVWA